MFYDERIEQTRGKISMYCIVISVFTALLIGGMRLVNILRNTDDLIYLWYASLDIVIAAGGFFCLLIGFIRHVGKEQDEMLAASKASFYNRAGKLYLKVVMVAYSILFPAVMCLDRPFNFTDIAYDQTLILLFFFLGTYCSYSFKKNEIYFNYSIIEEEHYYKAVWKNIGKFSTYTLLLFLLSLASFTSCFLVGKSLAETFLPELLSIILVYAIGFTAVVLIYLLCSFMEKESSDRTQMISRSTFLSLGITVGIYAVYSILLIVINTLPVAQVKQVQLILSAVLLLDKIILMSLLMFLIYFSFEYLKRNRNRLLNTSCLVILWAAIGGILFDAVRSMLTAILLMDIVNNMYISIFLSDIITWFTDVQMLAYLSGFSLLIVALIKDKRLSKANWIAIFSFVILFGVELFLRTQVDYVVVSTYHTVCITVILCYFCLLVGHLKKM